MLENNRQFLVEPVGDLQAELPVDGLLFAVGYEQRSTFVARELQGRYSSGLGLRFGSQEEGSFSENLTWCDAQPDVYTLLADTEWSARDAVAEWLRKFDARDSPAIRVIVDVSSLSRMLMAVIVSTCFECSRELGPIDVCFVYAPAEFTSPGDEHGPITKFGAVLPEFAGVSDSALGLATVIGLGYEPDLALATQQGLDPATCWMLTPTGVAERYDQAVARANARVLALMDTDDVLEYDVLRPFDAFMRVESLVAGLRRAHNVVLVPLGPKILALVCLLVAVVHAPDVGVWRVSAGRLGESRDVKADGRVTAIRAVFRWVE